MILISVSEMDFWIIGCSGLTGIYWTDLDSQVKFFFLLNIFIVIINVPLFSDFLENISPPNAKSQTPLTTTPNDQELLNLFT